MKWRAEEIEAAAAPDKEMAGRYRALAARANYLGLDRVDIAFPMKECCRRMPTIDWLALRRIVRYLLGHPRVVHKFIWHESGNLTVLVDTDFAGCLQTRRSTSGGCLMHGAHLVKHWATTQKTLALSSGEAELYGVVKGASEGLDLLSIASDLGIDASLSVRTDSIAAVGICNSAGIGRVRHLATGQLWVQEKIRCGNIKLFKHPGSENHGVVCTKHVQADLI